MNYNYHRYCIIYVSDFRSRHNIRSRSSSKGHSRRSSRDRSRSRRRSRSKSHSRRSRSRSSSHYRSRSKERYRHCSSSSPEIVAKQEQSSEEQLHAKLQRAIRAAQSADDQLRQQGLLSGIASRNDPIVYQSNIIDEINESSFIPKHFTSSKVTQELPVIDLTVDTPAVLQTAEEDPESIFHTSVKFSAPSSFGAALQLVRPSSSIAQYDDDDDDDEEDESLNQFITFSPKEEDTQRVIVFGTKKNLELLLKSLNLDPQVKLEKWVKKLFHLRQKAINGEPLT
ncbi:hypothetical protein C0J52_25997 [Blattella germanica]|nr:hypothetical protein C0J52_25997 [Blattella germanica]